MRLIYWKHDRRQGEVAELKQPVVRGVESEGAWRDNSHCDSPSVDREGHLYLRCVPGLNLCDT